MLNKYRYTIKNLNIEKIKRIDIIRPQLIKAKNTSQGFNGKSEDRLQRSVLRESKDGNSAFDINLNAYSSDNPVCKALLEFEARNIFPDTFFVVVEGKRKVYKILSKEAVITQETKKEDKL